MLSLSLSFNSFSCSLILATVELIIPGILTVRLLKETQLQMQLSITIQHSMTAKAAFLTPSNTDCAKH